MHHRVVALVASRVHTPYAPAPSFSAALQLAAARAWIRRTSTGPPVTSQVIETSSRGTHHSLDPAPGCNLNIDSSRKSNQLSGLNKVNFANSESGALPASPECKPLSVAPRSKKPSTTLGRRSPRDIIQQRQGDLPRPHAHYAFEQTLLRIIYFTQPPLNFPKIVDYFKLYPQFHSTRSFNTILSYALRHNAFGTFQSLLHSMHDSRIRRNMETWKLEVRFMVQTGAWHQAWQLVTNSLGDTPIPLPIWVEFFQLPKLGYTSPQPGGPRGPTNVKPSRLQLDTKSWDPRLKLLFERAPKDFAGLARLEPRVIRSIVSHLLRLKHSKQALMLTTSYLRALPRRLTPRWREGCTDIINAHIGLDASYQGLRQLSENLKLLKSLLGYHTNVRPDANTLFLLLGPLKKAKQSGTHAKRVVRDFVSKWGKDMGEDLRVRRRIVTLALKEGRMDIVKAYTKVKTTRSGIEVPSNCEGDGEAISKRELRRLPDKVAFPKEGKDRAIWGQVKYRARVALSKTKGRKLQYV